MFENKDMVTCSTEILEYYLFYGKIAPTEIVTCAGHVVDTPAVGNGISFSSFGDVQLTRSWTRTISP